MFLYNSSGRRENSWWDSWCYVIAKSWQEGIGLVAWVWSVERIDKIIIGWNLRWRWEAFYLPGLDSDTSHCAVHVDIPNCYIWDTCFGVVPPKATYADPMARSTVHIVYVYIWASCLDWDAVIACVTQAKTPMSTNIWDSRLVWPFQYVLCYTTEIYEEGKFCCLVLNVWLLIFPPLVVSFSCCRWRTETVSVHEVLCPVPISRACRGSHLYLVRKPQVLFISAWSPDTKWDGAIQLKGSSEPSILMKEGKDEDCKTGPYETDQEWVALCFVLFRPPSLEH